jgi:acyl carrier protein
MTPDTISAVVLDVLTAIAPEVDVAQLVGDRPLRRQVDLDSIDWLNFLIGLNQRLGVDIPEADYARLATLDDIGRYLAERLKT